MNSVWLEGNAVADSEVRFTKTGKSVSNFKLAIKSDDSDKQTAYIPVIVWNFQVPVPKGSRVRVAGRIQTRSWEAADGKRAYATEVVAENLTIIPAGKTGTVGTVGTVGTAATQGMGTDTSVTHYDGIEIPF